MSGQRDKGIVDSAQNAVRQATGTLRGEQRWHSPDSDVYHNNPNCQTGNSIEAENVRQGTGNKRLCRECERLSSAGGPVGSLTGL
jgi:hypothetical protein